MVIKQDFLYFVCSRFEQSKLQIFIAQQAHRIYRLWNSFIVTKARYYYQQHFARFTVKLRSLFVHNNNSLLMFFLCFVTLSKTRRACK